MAAHNELGKWGEAVAMRYLDAKGYQLVSHDWQSHHKDIDIIAIHPSGIYVFVEVKTRSAAYMRDTMLTPEKRYHLARIITTYCQQHNIHRARIDLIAITGTPESYKIEHVEAVECPSISVSYYKPRRYRR